jgi:16S rRNA (cytosine1402-N4)-methyltransferase
VHKPVLLKEVLEYLNPQPNSNFIDCTINGGGHSLEILKRIKPEGKILGIEWDKEVIERLESSEKRKEFGENLILVNDSYSNLKDIIKKNNFYSVSGILFDLGLSSWDLEGSGRGFSFQKDEPLDMRYSRESILTAEEIVNRWPEEDLVGIFREYGEERRARPIAKAICAGRKRGIIKTTAELVEVIKRAVPTRFQFGRTHFATRIFQALRMAVNDELGNARKGLEAALDVIAPGGRIAVISFHSLEDRLVKHYFREKSKEEVLKILTKKPVVPAEEELMFNPRARSAKLRVVEKI